MANFPQLIVLGARSFLGRALPDSFRSRFDETLALSSADCDLTDPNAVAQASARWCDGALILFTAVVNKGVEDSEASYRKNLSMTENVAKGARAREVAGVIFTSSVDVYGSNPVDLLIEHSPVRPDSWYGRAKAESESLLQKLLGGVVPLGIFRCPGIYDLSEHDRSVIGSLTRQAQSGGVITLHNGGRNRRDFVHANDLYVLFSLWCAHRKNGLWNAATGVSPTMFDVATQIVSVNGRGRIVTQESGGRNFDLSFDCSALTESFGRNPLRAFPVAYPESAAGIVGRKTTLARGNSKVRLRISHTLLERPRHVLSRWVLQSLVDAESTIIDAYGEFVAWDVEPSRLDEMPFAPADPAQGLTFCAHGEGATGDQKLLPLLSAAEMRVLSPGSVDVTTGAVVFPDELPDGVSAGFHLDVADLLDSAAKFAARFRQERQGVVLLVDDQVAAGFQPAECVNYDQSRRSMAEACMLYFSGVVREVGQMTLEDLISTLVNSETVFVQCRQPVVADWVLTVAQHVKSDFFLLPPGSGHLMSVARTIGFYSFIEYGRSLQDGDSLRSLVRTACEAKARMARSGRLVQSPPEQTVYTFADRLHPLSESLGGAFSQIEVARGSASAGRRRSYKPEAFRSVYRGRLRRLELDDAFFVVGAAYRRILPELIDSGVPYDAVRGFFATYLQIPQLRIDLAYAFVDDVPAFRAGREAFISGIKRSIRQAGGLDPDSAGEEAFLQVLETIAASTAATSE